MSTDLPAADDVLAAWMNALGAKELSYLQRRLSWDKIPISEASNFLRRSSNGELYDNFTGIQHWLKESPPITDERQPAEPPHVSFVELWRRIAIGATNELANTLPTSVATHYETKQDDWGEYDSIRRNLSDDLITKLSVICEPLLWSEFNRQRFPSQAVLAHLGAEGSAHQPSTRRAYCSFLEELRSDGLRSITAAYPVLQRHLSKTVEHWLETSAELLTRVYTDRSALVDAFHLPVGALLTEIRTNVSDAHRGGRTVAILTFTCGGPACMQHRLVYKPKDLRIDREFQSVLSETKPPPSAGGTLRGVRILVRAGYGYMEWIPHRLCGTEQELGAFYRNAGRLTAVLYLLGGTDCHHENLIACGDQLLLVDAETLFEAVPASDIKGVEALNRQTGLHQQISTSVARLGLLPQWQFVGQQRIPRDVSALGIEPPQRPSQRSPGWIGLNTDGMIAADTEQTVSLPTSLPVGIGSPNRLHDFLDEYCQGFEHQLLTILEDKHQWLGLDGLLARFRRHTRRFVLRPTWMYMWLQKQLFEPSSLMSETNQRLTLEKLARTYLLAVTKPNSWPLFAAEVAQMEMLDVPFFEQSIDGLNLVAPDGTEITNYFEASGYDNARQKLEQLDRPTIDLQVKLVRGILMARNMHPDHSFPRHASSASLVLNQAPSGNRWQAAEAVSNLLIDTSITDPAGAVEWLGIDIAEDADRCSYGPLGPSLYGGRSGIALFLAAMSRDARVESDTAISYRRAALSACSDLQSLWTVGTFDDRYRWWRDQPLGLAGSGGILLALNHLTELLPDAAQNIMDGMALLLESLDVDLLRSDQRLDVMYGCAGIIGPLLKVGSPTALALARAAGDTLIGRQDACGGWINPIVGETALTGFSHGAAGMAAALARLHSRTGEESLLAAATRAIAYERSTFVTEECNWPDFRGTPSARAPRFMLSWCHGAPGVALSRLCMSNTSVWDAKTNEEIDCALTSTAGQDSAGDSLCCGRFGRAAILRIAARHRSEPKWLGNAVKLERQAIGMNHINGRYSFVDILGLFTGAAGAGLALLDTVSTEDRRLLPSILSGGLLDNVPSNGHSR